MATLQPLKDYSGSVYGGLGQLLYAYSQTKHLSISEQLQHVQQVERFDFSIWRELLNDIAAQVPHPALGLDIAASVEPKHLGIIAYIAMACDTLAEALARYYEYHRLIYDGSPLLVEGRGEYLYIRWADLPQHLVTQLTDEIAIALLVKFLTHFLGLNEFSIHQVNFSLAAPKSIQIYEQYFSCKVKFSQPHTELILPSAILNKPIQQADQTLQQLLMQQAQALLDKLPHSTQLDERLQQGILMGLQKNNYQIEAIAQQLSMSVRQLQRHLQAQHTTYQQRVQQVRQVLALQYLDDPHLSLHEIALLLSYSEQSAFQRAFKHWTGQTPQSWRKQLG
ncbi:AraC family transcriptional regulator [Acinetobacter calcoaceticus]|uniref:AraC family transcriptional regulator n=1 Tax=Acinetobacter calcoaceticus TaxID=471 RepID=A0A4R1Y3U2_ACICA|nr:AraC family transcriptional regulator [Acinetobacter calcoaceticus]